MIGAKKRQPDGCEPRRDPWEDVTEAKTQRSVIFARWIADARYRSRRRSQRTSALPWGPPAGAVAMQAILPLAAGYFLSYLLRNVNGTLAGGMVEDLGIGADKLGQLTSVYLLVFALAQLPVGAMLDRFGAGRVQTLLLLCAAAGAGLCAHPSSFAWQLVGRALVGLGTAGCLVAGMKASAAWFPRERLPLVNGAFVMCGGIGALAATWPVERALHSTDWHGVYGALAIACLAVALCIAAFVPKARPAEVATGADLRLWKIVNDPQFRRFAPLSACCFGTVLGVQGLWAGRWLADVQGLSPPEVAADLAWMATALIVAAPLWGALTAWLRARGQLADALAGTAILLIGCEAAIMAGLGSGAGLPVLPWFGFALFGGMTVLSFSLVAEHFPTQALGRANAALNVLHIGASFLVQFLIGQIVAQWTSAAGHYPAQAFQAGLLLAVVAQVTALLWFARGRVPRRVA